jgi:hypothetical protein
VNDLLNTVLDAHGGLRRWSQAASIRATADIGGPMWARRGQAGIFGKAHLVVDVQQQHVVFTDFTTPGLRGVYTPGRVAIEDPTGKVVLERHSPREAYQGQELTSAWDELHALYFGGYAMWNYLTTPYLLAHPDVRTEELAPWQPDGEQWRRLRAVFPPHIATHSTEQILSYDTSGLLRRHDYHPYVMGDRPVAHRTEAHRTVAGLVFPTHRYVLPVADGHPLPNPIITIDLTNIAVD